MANAQTRAITACRDPAGGAVQAALSGLGWVLVGRAPEGTALLRQVSERQPDAVILDAILPGADGLAFIRRARRLKENQDATRLPQDAPRSVTGPSYPAEPPDATVRTDAVDLTGITAGGT